MRKNELRLPLRSVLRRGHYLVFFGYYLYSLWMDWRIAGRSMSQTVFNRQSGAYAVQCISYPYLHELIGVLRWKPDDVLADVGCAWGRLLGYLERKTDIRDLIGIEINPEAAGTAKQIFRGSRRVRILEGDVLDVLPEEATILFLFNPFDDDVMCRFLDLVEACRKRPLRLYYLYPTCRQQFSGRGLWKLEREVILQPRHLGPLSLCEFSYTPIEAGR